MLSACATVVSPVGRTHADDTVPLARGIPYASPAWEKRYSRRNSSESRNSIQERSDLKRLPVHGMPRGYSQVLLGDFMATQRTLVRLVREATNISDLFEVKPCQ